MPTEKYEIGNDLNAKRIRFRDTFEREFIRICQNNKETFDDTNKKWLTWITENWVPLMVFSVPTAGIIYFALNYFRSIDEGNRLETSINNMVNSLARIGANIVSFGSIDLSTCALKLIVGIGGALILGGGGYYIKKEVKRYNKSKRFVEEIHKEINKIIGWRRCCSKNTISNLDILKKLARVYSIKILMRYEFLINEIENDSHGIDRFAKFCAKAIENLIEKKHHVSVGEANLICDFDRVDNTLFQTLGLMNKKLSQIAGCKYTGGFTLLGAIKHAPALIQKKIQKTDEVTTINYEVYKSVNTKIIEQKKKESSDLYPYDHFKYPCVVYTDEDAIQANSYQKADFWLTAIFDENRNNLFRVAMQKKNFGINGTKEQYEKFHLLEKKLSGIKLDKFDQTNTFEKNIDTAKKFLEKLFPIIVDTFTLINVGIKLKEMIFDEIIKKIESCEGFINKTEMFSSEKKTSAVIPNASMDRLRLLKEKCSFSKQHCKMELEFLDKESLRLTNLSYVIKLTVEDKKSLLFSVGDYIKKDFWRIVMSVTALIFPTLIDIFIRWIKNEVYKQQGLFGLMGGSLDNTLPGLLSQWSGPTLLGVVEQNVPWIQLLAGFISVPILLIYFPNRLVSHVENFVLCKGRESMRKESNLFPSFFNVPEKKSFSSTTELPGLRT